MRLYIEFQPSFHRWSYLELSGQENEGGYLEFKIGRNDVQKEVEFSGEIANTTIKSLVLNAQVHLRAASFEEKVLGLDGVTIRGQLHIEEECPMEFEFWSPRKGSASLCFVQEVLRIIKEQQLPEDVSKYVSELEQYIE